MSKTNFDKLRLNELDVKLDCTVADALYVASRSIKRCRPTIYLAGPWFDKRAKKLMDAVIKIVDECKYTSKYNVYIPMLSQSASPVDVFNKDVKGVADCDMVVALISRKDVGTAFEIGMAYAMGKRIVLMGLDDSCFLTKTNVMLAYCTQTCITIDKFAKLLHMDLSLEDCIPISDSWEGIE